MIRDKIKELVKEYYKEKFIKPPFDASKTDIRYAGRIFDENELIKLVDASLDFWLTEGRFAEEFAEKISEYLGIDNVILVNSGSSANLVALSALTSTKLGEKKLSQGDEVLSVAASFPSTIAPIIQNNLIPVLVDVDLETYNVNIEQLEKAISSKTKCIFIAHTLGNPFNLERIAEIAEKHNLWIIEDNCDSLGSKYNGKYTGTFGHISTMSFYPAHHITTGEGGAIATNDEQLSVIIKSFRDWGRDCYCAGGENSTCGKRYSQQFGTLPFGYDHKYVYSELGYNLKMTDMQAAIGSAQMDKIEWFCERRRENFVAYQEAFKKHEDIFILPKATENADPSWFGYVLSLKNDVSFKREKLTQYLSENRIETRNLFSGNIIRQPAFIGRNFRIASDLKNTDYIMNNTFFLGTFPGISKEMIEYIDNKIIEFKKNI